MRRLRKLFEPIKVADVQIRNRIVMSPMGLGRATEDGFVTDVMVDFYIERAKGGAGLINIVCGYNDFCVYLPHIPALEDDKYIPGLKRMTDAIHEHGAKTFAHIINMGSSCFGTKGRRPATSAVGRQEHTHWVHAPRDDHSRGQASGRPLRGGRLESQRGRLRRRGTVRAIAAT